MTPRHSSPSPVRKSAMLTLALRASGVSRAFQRSYVCAACGSMAAAEGEAASGVQRLVALCVEAGVTAEQVAAAWQERQGVM